MIPSRVFKARTFFALRAARAHKVACMMLLKTALKFSSVLASCFTSWVVTRAYLSRICRGSRSIIVDQRLLLVAADAITLQVACACVIIRNRNHGGTSKVSEVLPTSCTNGYETISNCCFDKKDNRSVQSEENRKGDEEDAKLTSEAAHLLYRGLSGGFRSLFISPCTAPLAAGKTTHQKIRRGRLEEY